MEFFEPLGLLDGPVGFAAIRDGLALPLQGGPLAFTLLRDGTGQWRALEDAPEALTRAPAPFARMERHRARPLVMGIVNCTPDSFSGDGLGDLHAAAIAQGVAMLEAGADLLDIGGESTRPGAEPVPPEEEIARILPVVRELARLAPVSLDTRNARTMAAGLEAGAAAINDVSALRHDGDALRVIAQARCPVILMHARTTDPRTMQRDVAYVDAALEVARFLEGRVATIERLGIPRSRIAVDPGIGFGKRVQDNLDVVTRLPLLASIGCTILVGASRKGFVGKVTGVEEAGRRVMGSVALALEAASRGAHVVRVHDVAATVQALRMQEAVRAGFEA
ncbi:dihydropteroate synthase [Sabulicella glaciei]|uniref:dihydropteroate synthase n=1 Tax=Sabulicella glaciei TaxID=2984948 RepID=A0ABT3P2U4_9PROT|nr:dihydropteroate synthase [Roseococcus sp. MDT2-1-1]